MIIICINLPRMADRAALALERWGGLGELVFLPATEAARVRGTERAAREGGRMLAPGEIACRESHNRAVRLVRAIGRPCAVIEDDAVPLPGFSWPAPPAKGRLQLFWHGAGRFGTVAAIVAPDCPLMPRQHAADWWPPGYPVTYLDAPIVAHGSPGETSIHGRPGNPRTEV